jgi:hypothetical protein
MAGRTNDDSSNKRRVHAVIVVVIVANGNRVGCWWAARSKIAILNAIALARTPSNERNVKLNV